MGMAVVGFGLLGLSLFYIAYQGTITSNPATMAGLGFGGQQTNAVNRDRGLIDQAANMPQVVDLHGAALPEMKRQHAIPCPSGD